MAGSDPAGGAGLQLDLKVFAALQADGAAVPAVLTVQDPAGLRRVDPVDADQVEDALRAVFAFGPVAALKTGALGSAGVVAAVARVAGEHPEVPLVCDPVLRASSAAGGGRLLDPDAVPQLVRLLLPRAALLTPNLAEAAELSGVPVTDPAGMKAAAAALRSRGARAVLVKGGHLTPAADTSADLLDAEASQPIWLRAERIAGADEVHGTGCALSAAAAVFLAQGCPVETAARNAKAVLLGWLQDAAGGRLVPLP